MSPFLDVGDISVSRSGLGGRSSDRRKIESRDPVIEAVTVHFGTIGTGVPRCLQRFSGGLAPWQCKRARDLMLDDLAHCPSLSAVASACGLSNRQFHRAFKASNGLSPHRWLLGARVDRAREMLEKSAASIAEVAHACGFADQSHLTRVFQKLVGAAPGAWRRAKACSADLEQPEAAVDGWPPLRTGTNG